MEKQMYQIYVKSRCAYLAGYGYSKAKHAFCYPNQFRDKVLETRKAYPKENYKMKARVSK